MAAHLNLPVLISMLSTSGDVEGTARQQVFTVCHQLDRTTPQAIVYEQHTTRTSSNPRAERRCRGLDASQLSVESLESVEWKCDRTRSLIYIMKIGWHLSHLEAWFIR